MIWYSATELRNQYRTIRHILRLEGFSKQLVNEIQSTKKHSVSKPKKNVVSTIVFDAISEQHQFLRNIFQHSNIDSNKYYMPMDAPGKKLEQLFHREENAGKTEFLGNLKDSIL